MGNSKRRPRRSLHNTNQRKPAQLPCVSRPSKPSRPSLRVLEAILFLYLRYVLSPLASFLFLLGAFVFVQPMKAAMTLTRTTIVVARRGARFLCRVLLLEPVRLAHNAWRGLGRMVDRLFIFPQAEARVLRATVQRLEQRLKRAEHNLRLHRRHIHRLLHPPSPLVGPEVRREHQARHKEVHSPVPSPSVPLAASPPPLPPPPPPAPVPAVRPIIPSAPKTVGKKKGSTTASTPTISLQDLLRVKLKPTQCVNSSETLNRPDPTAFKPLLKPAQKGLNVSLADITNVQLRRTQRRSSVLSVRAAATSPLKVPLSFKLRRVEGIERSPGGTPIRPEFAISSQENTVDKFATALKKKFESSLIHSPPRSATSSVAASPISPGSPDLLNGSLGLPSFHGLGTVFSPSTSFFGDSVIPSPIRPDKL